MAGKAGQHTVDVPDAQRFDEAALLAYMRGRIPGIPDAGIRIRKFGYGQSNPTFFVEAADGSRRWVMRKKPHGKLVKSAHMVEREYQVMAALGPRGFPVPKMLFLCEDSSVIGTPFYVMDFCKGRVVDNGLRQVAKQDRAATLRAIVETLAKLHSTDLDQAGLGDFGRRGGYYTRQIQTMTKVSNTQAEGGAAPIEAREKLLAYFRANLPADRTTLVHGDWKPDNCILAPDSPSVLAVVDWEMSTLGHPLTDLANMCLPYYIPKKGPLGMVYQRWADGVPPIEDVHRHYCSLTGISYPIEGWRFAVAFAFFRLSVIMQGIVARASKGQASSGAAAALSGPAGVKMFNMVADTGLSIVTDGSKM